MNRIKTFVLMVVLTALFLMIGNLIAGRTGIIFAFFFAGIMNFVSYWYSDKIVLSMYGAKKIEEGDFPEIYSIVREVSLGANIPTPSVYLIENASPNAFATGRAPEHSAVALTTGIIKLLDKEELKGVIAHEISHIKNRDTLVQTVAATIAGAIMMFASIARWSAIFGGFSRDNDRGGNIISLIVIAVLAPIAALLIQMAISRSREYMADEGSAKLTKNPLSLAHALKKLEGAVKIKKMEVNQATSHLFIVNPLRGNFIAGLFSTHPPIEERIKRLENLEII